MSLEISEEDDADQEEPEMQIKPVNIPINIPVKKMERRETLSDLLIIDNPKQTNDIKRVDTNSLVTFRLKPDEPIQVISGLQNQQAQS